MHRQPILPRRRPRVVFIDELQSMAHRQVIQIHAAARRKLVRGSLQRFRANANGESGLSSAATLIIPFRSRGSAYHSSRSSSGPWGRGCLTKPAASTTSLGLESGTRRASRDQRPRRLRPERFAQQPALIDAALQQRFFNGARVILNRPRQRARIGELHEPHPALQRRAKTGDQRPISVQAR